MKSLNAAMKASREKREANEARERGRLRAIGAEFIVFAEWERQTHGQRLAIARARFPHRVKWCPGCYQMKVAGDGVCPQCVELVGRTMIRAGGG